MTEQRSVSSAGGMTLKQTVVWATIDAGVCGFVTQVSATSPDKQSVTLALTSPCQNIQDFAALLDTVDAYAEIGAGFDGKVHQAARAALRGCCSGCVVPVGAFKAMQIAAALALPKEASMRFEKGEEQGAQAMRVEILGTGCAKCQALAANAEEAVRQAGLEAAVEKVTGVADIAKRGALFTPALAIDGEVVVSGRVADVPEIVALIATAQAHRGGQGNG